MSARRHSTAAFLECVHCSSVSRVLKPPVETYRQNGRRRGCRRVKVRLVHPQDMGKYVYFHPSTFTGSQWLNKADNPLPPMGLATLITALHCRPFQTLPMLFTPLLVFSSYLSVA